MLRIWFLDVKYVTFFNYDRFYYLISRPLSKCSTNFIFSYNILKLFHPIIQ